MEMSSSEKLDSIDASITALQSGKANTNHTHSNYASSTHTHSGYASTNHSHSNYAESEHTHDQDEITGLTDVLNSKASSTHSANVLISLYILFILIQAKLLLVLIISLNVVQEATV